MATTETFRKRVLYEADTTSLAKAADDLQKLAKANDGAAVAAEKHEKRTISLATAVERAQRRLDEGYRSTQQYARDEKLLTAAVNEGALSIERKNELLALSAARYKVGQVANENFARSTGLARHELVNLSRQLQDVGTMAAMGAGPMQILSSQGAQVVDIFTSSQATMKGFASQVAAAITPARVLVATLAGGAGLVAYAMWQWTDSQLALNKALTGTGLSAGVTRDQLSRMADEAARTSKTSIAAARDSLAAFANTGKISAGLMPSLTGMSRPLGAQLGLDAAAANKMLADSFAEPLEGYRKLTSAVGGYSIMVEDQIRKLLEQGRRQDAQNLLLQETQRRVAPLIETTSEMARAWQRATDGLSNFIMKVGELTSGPLARFMNTSMDVLNGIGRGVGAVSDWRQNQVAQSRPARLLAGVDIDQRALDAANRALAEIGAHRDRLLANPNLLGGDPQSIARYNQELENTNKRYDDQAKIVARLEAARGRQDGPLRGPTTRYGEAFLQFQRESTTLTEEQARLQPELQNAMHRRAEAMARQAEQAARIREAEGRALENQNLAITQGRALGAMDTRRLADAHQTAAAYQNIGQTVERMRAASPQDQAAPGFGETLRNLERQYEVAGEKLRSMFTRQGAGMFNAQGDFTASSREVEARLKREIDLIGERNDIEARGAAARTSQEHTRVEQDRRRQQMDQQGNMTPAERQRELDGIARVRAAQDNRAIAEAIDARTIATRNSIAAIQAEAAAMSGSAGEQEAARLRVQMIAQARQEYIRQFGINAQVPQAELDAIDRMAKAMGEARQQALLLKTARDLVFDRQLIGMSDSEQRIAQQMRSLWGDNGWRQQMGSAEASAMRFNDQLKQSLDLSRGFGADLLSGLREGKSGFEAILGAATKFSQKLADIGMNRFIDAMVTGKNPFEAFMNGQSGAGGAQGIFSLSPIRFLNGIQSAVSSGTGDALTSFSGTSQGGGLQGGESGGWGNGAQLAGAGMTMLGAYGAGKQGGALAGGIQGFMSGMATGNPFLAVASAAIGAITSYPKTSKDIANERDHNRKEWAACLAAH